MSNELRNLMSIFRRPFWCRVLGHMEPGDGAYKYVGDGKKTCQIWMCVRCGTVLREKDVDLKSPTQA